MRRAHGYKRWALAAAGGLGVSFAAAAPGANQPAARQVVAAAQQPARENAAGQDRLAEVRLELAWLADPGTFPCQLAARVSNGMMEVGGVVHGEQLRRRVLQLAGEHGKLPVRDKLTVLAVAAARPAGHDNNQDLCRSASAAMSRLTAGQAGSFEVSADSNGQIAVVGSIGSCEEKLKVSRHLSQLPGCTAVVNNLVATRVIREGKVHTVVSADARLTVAGEPEELLPPMHAIAQGANTVTPELATSVKAASATTFAPVQPAKDSPYTSQLQSYAPPANQYGGATAVSATPQRYNPAAPQQQVIYEAPAYTPPAEKPTVIASGSTYGGAYNPAAPKPAPPRPAAAPIQQVAAKVSTENLRPASVKPVDVSSEELSNMVRRRIETAFHGGVRDVTVKVTGERQLQIKLHVVRATDGPTLGKRIMNLPELAPYKVDLQIPVE